MNTFSVNVLCVIYLTTFLCTWIATIIIRPSKIKLLISCTNKVMERLSAKVYFVLFNFVSNLPDDSAISRRSPSSRWLPTALKSTRRPYSYM